MLGVSLRVRINYDGGGPRPSDKVKVGGGVGGGERDIQTLRERGPGFQKNIFGPLGLSLVTIRGGEGPSPGSATDLHLSYS